MRRPRAVLFTLLLAAVPAGGLAQQTPSVQEKPMTPMTRASLEGVQLEYELRGGGEPVVLVHAGVFASWYGPLVTEPALASRYRLLSYHRVGYMGSSRIAGPVSLAEQAGHLRALLRHVGIGRAHLVGHSSGGNIALQLALDAPEMVQSLALLEPALVTVVNRSELPRVFERYKAGDKAGAVDSFMLAVTGPAYRAGLERALPGAFDEVGTYRLCVVDNASTDETVELASRLAPEASVLELGRNAGYAAAINAAMSKQPRADYALVLNPDIRLHARSVPALLNAVQRPGVGIAVPRMVDEHGALQHSLRREPTVLRAFGEAVLGGRRASRHCALGEVVGRAEYYDFEQAAAWATGAAMLISRACSDAVGAWDESFFLYSEETDYCLRARDRGFFTWYEPTATVMHIGGQSGQSAKTHTMQVVNRVRLYRRRHRAPLAWAFLLMTAARELSWVPRGGAWNGTAARALFRPATRPAELGCSDSVLPS